MKDYYYIKFQPLDYDDAPYYLCTDRISKKPTSLKVFDNIEDAIEYKNKEFDRDTYRALDYEILIERF